ncbi:hypothetical protein BC831DRAFT_476283 [Entophlyctis helioformis]|nr:hypothetical protein BC831DRAFT_476283 [Entophlyctis helioformis]
MRRLPVELLSLIARFLDKPSHLRALALVNRACFSASIARLWAAPRIGPTVRRAAWLAFIHALLNRRRVLPLPLPLPPATQQPDSDTLYALRRTTYLDFVLHVDDVWLFVGGEDGEVDEVDGSSQVQHLQLLNTDRTTGSDLGAGDTHGTDAAAQSSPSSSPSPSDLVRLDSGIGDITATQACCSQSGLTEQAAIPPDTCATAPTAPDALLAVPAVFARYSLQHALFILMSSCTNLRSLRLQFFCDNFALLPWGRALSRLVSLDLRMRVTDDFVRQCFAAPLPPSPLPSTLPLLQDASPKEPSTQHASQVSPLVSTVGTAGHCRRLARLSLSWAEMSNEGLRTIARACPRLASITAFLTDMSQRSRYQRLVEPGTGQQITDEGIRDLLQECRHLESLHIWKLSNVTPAAYVPSMVVAAVPEADVVGADVVGGGSGIDGGSGIGGLPVQDGHTSSVSGSQQHEQHASIDGRLVEQMHSLAVSTPPAERTPHAAATAPDANQDPSGLSRLKEITLMLSTRAGMDMDAILRIVEHLDSLQVLRICGGTSDHYLSDRVISECDLLALPLQRPTLKSIRLADLDFCKKTDAIASYYGGTGMSWMVDELTQQFRAVHPGIELGMCLDPRSFGK